MGSGAVSDEMLGKMKRSFAAQLAGFCVRNGLKGRVTLMGFVALDAMPEKRGDSVQYDTSKVVYTKDNSTLEMKSCPKCGTGHVVRRGDEEYCLRPSCDWSQTNEG